MNKKILILDDEQEYIVELKKFLHEFNYAVCITMFADQALEIIKRDKPNLVLFDYKLPDMDGDSFLERAKKLSPSIPYILITAWNDPIILDRFKKLGACDVVLKPVDLAKLVEKIQTILKDKK